MAEHRNSSTEKNENLRNQRTTNAQHRPRRKRKAETSGSFKNDPDKSDEEFQSDPQDTRRH